MDYEPMTLGSPVHSPGHVSPGLHQGLHGSQFQQHSNQFLPGYLMGDISTPAASPSMRTKPASGKLSHNASFSGLGSRSPTMLRKAMPQTPKHATFMSPSVTTKEKVGTPPVHTLMDDINQTDVSYTQGLTDLPMRLTQDQHSTLTYGGGTPAAFQHSSVFSNKNKSPPSPGQSDPFYTQGELITPETQLDDTWITVFGFSSSTASYVIQRFSQYGNIISHHTASNGGNWMHIHYETSLQARKALSRNGKVFPGNIMIGVLPCIDVKLMSEQQPPESFNTSLFQSPAQTPVGGKPATPLRLNKPPSLRPLTAAYKAAASEHAVSRDTRTPQKTDGMLTKAIDYLFG